MGVDNPYKIGKCGPMIDIAELESRLNKVRAKAERAKSAFEAASIEVERLETTLSVVREMIGGKSEATVGNSELTTRQKFVFNSLKIGQNNALSPVDVFQVAKERAGFEGDVNYVRTTLWRMANNGKIGSASGTYWRFPIDSVPESTEALSQFAAGLPAQSASGDQWDDDLDSEIPF